MKVLVDSREQKPYSFKESETVTLETGDYTLQEVDTAIERKTKSDFLQSITQERERFERECRRADDFEKPMIILVEAPREDFEKGVYHSAAHPNAVIGTIETWEECYNIEFVFENGRRKANQRATAILKAWAGESKFSF